LKFDLTLAYKANAKICLKLLNDKEFLMGSNDSSNNENYDEQGNVAVEEARPKTKKPPLYKVVLLNDDYTPMEFVVQVLETFFSLDRTKATQIMLQVHTEGKGVCGVFPRDIAETKAAQVEQCALENDHPLKCEVELA